MADSPLPRARIVPIMARQTPKTRASGKAGRSLRQKVLKGEAVDKEALRLPCLEARRLYAAPIKGDGKH